MKIKKYRSEKIFETSLMQYRLDNENSPNKAEIYRFTDWVLRKTGWQLDGYGCRLKRLSDNVVISEWNDISNDEEYELWPMYQKGQV